MLHKQTRVLDMTQGNVLQLLLSFSLPVFLGNLLQQFYNLADTALAGNILGDTALAQIGATSALYSMLTVFAFGLNTGFTLIVSRCFGAGNKDGVRRSAGWMICLSISIALLITAGLLLFRRPLLTLLQVPEEVYEGALAYITVIFAGVPLTMLFNMESGLLRAVGNSTTPLLFLLFSSVLNILLDLWFMASLGLGIRGAAAATILAQGISALLGLIYLFHNYPQFRFKRRDLLEGRKIVPEMLRTGFNMALMSAIYSLGSVILQGAINGLGSTYIAAQMGGRKLAEMFMLPGDALGTSIATYSSQNFGAGKRTRIKRGCRTGIWMYLTWWGIALIFLFTVAPTAVSLITGSDDRQVLSSALLYLKISIPMFPPMGILVIIRNVLQGMQHQTAPLIASGMELVIKVLFAVWLVPNYGYEMVCICEPVAWIICMCFILIAFFKVRAEFKDMPVKE